MDDSNTIRKFTAADIEKYHSGQLSAAQMHAMEKAALEDPFLSDALDGYAQPGINVQADLDLLRSRLAEKTEEAKVIPLKAVGGGGQRKFPWLRAAAVVLLIAGAGILAQKIFTGKNEKGIASTNTAAGKEDAGTAKRTSDEAPAFSNNTDSQVLKGTTTDANHYLANTNNNTSGKETNLTAINETTSRGVKNNPSGNAAANNTVTPASAAANSETERLYKVDDVAATNRSAGEVNARTGGIDVKPASPVQKLADSSNNAQYWSANTPGNENKKFKARKVAPDADGAIDFFDREQQNKTNNTAAGAGNYRQVNSNNSQANVFRGRVTDANNVGLPFARIMNPADNNAGTYTDVRGYFTITYPDTSVNVQVRSVGFDNSNLQLRSNLASNQVTLKEDKSLAEVVVSTKKPNADRRHDANMKLEEPEPLDGWDNYDTYIANNVEIPDELKSKPSASAAVVEVSFEVNKYGEPVNIKIEKSLCSKCDAEAIRLVKDGPKWRRNANKKGRTTVTISF